MNYKRVVMLGLDKKEALISAMKFRHSKIGL